MNAADFIGALPLVVLAVCSLIVLMASAFTRGLVASFAITLAGLAVAAASLGLVGAQAPLVVAGLLSFDRFVLFGLGLIIAGTFVSAISSWATLRRRGHEGGDYFFLLLLSALGACILAAANAFATFFLGLELMSVSLYALIGWRRESGIGTEAAIKYLILAGASSAFLLFGMALVYAETGTMELSRLAAGSAQGLVIPVGLGMMLVATGFKLAVVPFHLWTPDIYDGAPAPVTGYIATVSKGAMVVVLARAFAPALVGTGGVNGLASPGSDAVSAAFPWVFAFIAALSMFAGNLLALREANVKRILAYSSIAHLGYVLVAFLAGGADALNAIAFYLVAYFAASLGAFAIIGELSTTPERDADTIDDYRGLAVHRPWLAGIFTAMLLSLAGLPLTAGFVGKFLILKAGAAAELWTLAVMLAVNGTISIFYYLKIVSAMFRGFERAPSEIAAAPGAAARAPLLTALVLAVLVLAVVALGVYPSPLLAFVGAFTTAGP